MQNVRGHATISTPAELARHTHRFIDHFCRQSAFPSDVTIQIEQKPDAKTHGSPRSSALKATLESRKLTIHLREASLLGITPLALQGWLDMELARRQLEFEPALYRVNFNKEIRPHFYISGSGLHLVRHLVMHLEESLKNQIAAQLVMEIGHSEPLKYAFYEKITPSTTEKKHYERLVPHEWLRAIFLANKNREFSPVALLAERGPAAELESYWWNCHVYLSPEDKRILKTLFRQSNKNPVKYFSATLVEMFKYVKSQLLIH